MVSTRIKHASKRFRLKLLKKERLRHEHVKQLTPYKGAFKPIKFWCYHHKASFWKQPNQISVSKYICNICFKQRGVNGYKKGTKKFKQQVYDRCGNNYKVLGKYETGHTPILMEHSSKKCLYYKKHHKFYKFKMAPDWFISQGHRCPACMWVLCHVYHCKTSVEFKKQIFNLTNGHYIVLSKYKHHEIPVLLEHHNKNCHYYKKYRKFYKWHTTPDHIMSILGSSSQGGTYICPIDAYLHQISVRSKSDNEFKHQVFNQVGLKYKVLSKYKNSKTKVLFEHHDKNCLYYQRHHTYYYFWMTPSGFLYQGYRCPFNRSSRGERLVGKWLMNHGLKINKDYFYAHICKHKSIPGSKRNQHFDFYLPHVQHGIDIEFDGKQHFNEVNFTGSFTSKQLKHNLEENIFRDKMKAKYCAKHGISQIHIQNKQDLVGKQLIKLVNSVLNQKLLPLIK